MSLFICKLIFALYKLFAEAIIKINQWKNN